MKTNPTNPNKKLLGILIGVCALASVLAVILVVYEMKARFDRPTTTERHYQYRHH